MFRELWGKAAAVDVVVADANQLLALLGPSAGPEGPVRVRIITRQPPVARPAAGWQFTIVRGTPSPEFFLFYRLGSAFPQGALVFTGGLGEEGWVTFHRRPFVLHRLRERFNQLFIPDQQLAAVAAVREQAAGPGGRGASVSPPADAQPRLASPDEVYRRVLASHFLRIGRPEARKDSTYTLATHQERAYERARDIVDRFGGVIIADAVGLGKTYIGMRLLDRSLEAGGRVLVIVPAAVREQWERELAYLDGVHPARSTEARLSGGDEELDLFIRESGRVTLLSMESLGRRSFDSAAHSGAELVLVDEAHNFRNSGTHRYRCLADIVRHSQLALLTATPINNSILDLRHLLDLFVAPGSFRHLGISDYRELFRQAAAGKGDVGPIISAVVVRRTRRFLRQHYGEIIVRHPSGGHEIELRFPKRRRPVAVAYDLAATYGDLFAGLESWLDSLQFPFISPGVGETEANDELAFTGELLKIILLKRLESSIEAFRCTVIQQLAWCNTALRAIDSGRVLTRPDYRAVFKGPDDDPGSQLAFFELMLPAPSVGVTRIAHFREALENDMAILARIHTTLSAVGSSNDFKLQRLIELLDGPLAGQKILVFTEFRDTARYVYHALRHRPFLAQIDSEAARLGLERASRREVIERFAPKSNGLREPPRRERVDLLVATDVLSEGLNLQDASVVVSYDLPWNPVRLMQRAGRVDRLGAQSEYVELYHFAPAGSLDRILGLMSRLQSKVTTIDATLGLDSPVLAAPAATIEQIRTLACEADGYEKIEENVEGPLDPEEQAYLDYVELSNTELVRPTNDTVVAVAKSQGADRPRAVSYWQMSCRGRSRGLWLICDLDNGCVIEDQAGALDVLRRARELSTSGLSEPSMTTARRACEHFARGVLARLEAAHIAGDALSPGLPQCRIAAWLSRNLRDGTHRLTRGQLEVVDTLLERLAQRFTLPAERNLSQLAAELPETLNPVFLGQLGGVLQVEKLRFHAPAELTEVATLLVLAD